MPQVTISLKPSEKDALILLADQERRKLQDMAGLLVREALELRGLIEPFQFIERPNLSEEKEAPNNPIPPKPTDHQPINSYSQNTME